MQWHLESNLNYQRTMDIEWLAKMSPYTCCQHQSTTGLASCREEPCPHLHFGVLRGYIIWAGRLGVLPARSNSLKRQWSAMKILGFRKSSSGVFIFIYFFVCFLAKVKAWVLHSWLSPSLEVTRHHHTWALSSQPPRRMGIISPVLKIRSLT